MKIIPVNMADFDSVIIKNNTPHCKKHGAMNKVSSHKNGGGYWRCMSVVSKNNDCVCRSGCEQIK